MFGSKILTEVDSEFSGHIRVVSYWGSRYIATGILTQSGGLVRDVWEPVLKKFGRNNSSWLILGLAGGTIAGIVAKRFQPQKLVGVEIDPIMIDLGKKYLNLTAIPNLEIVMADARTFVSRLTSKFDFILVDMYFGDQLPDFVYHPVFLNKLKKSGGVVIFNHLFYDEPKRHNAEALVTKLKKIFSRVSLQRKLTNLLIICS